jgi:hypothetical protein
MASFAESAYLRGPSGETAEVDVGDRLRINPKSEFQLANEDGRAFSWASLNKDPDAGDTMFAVENNSTTHLLCIEKVIISMTVAGGSVCPVFTASGVTMAGTTSVDAVCLNRGNSSFNGVALSTAYTDETGNGEAAGSWATRLYMPQCLTSVPYTIDVGGAVRLPNDHMIGVDIIEAGTAANVTFVGWFEPV